MTMKTRVSLVETKKGVDLSCHHDIRQMRERLEEGPLRFAPTKPERSTDDQLFHLSVHEMECFEEVIDTWDAKHPLLYIPEHVVLRYARNSQTPFDRRAAWKLMSKLTTQPTIVTQLTISIDDMASQLRSKTLFPPPGLQTINGHEVIYMRPARYAPSKTPFSDVIDNLAYCVNAVMEREAPCRNGIAFMANMKGWTMQNYGTAYCLELIKMFQGLLVPMRVHLFLIVNPPRWFKNVWSMTKPMLSNDFQRKVRVIPEAKLAKYLAPGYAEYLPDEMVTGKAPTDAIVQDFIAYRAYVECVDLELEAESSSTCETLDESSSRNRESGRGAPNGGDVGSKLTPRKTKKVRETLRIELRPSRRQSTPNGKAHWYGNTWSKYKQDVLKLNDAAVHV